MSQTDSHPANWYPDPIGRHELRYYDGTQWTEHVSSSGRQGVDPLVAPRAPVVTHSTAKVQDQVARAGVQAGAVVGSGTLFTEPVLVVNQKAKLIEVHNEYAIFDQNGLQIGAVRQVGQCRAGEPGGHAFGEGPRVDQPVQVAEAVGEGRGQIAMSL